MLQRDVVSAASVPAQGFVRLSPQSLCSFPDPMEKLAAKPFKSLRFHEGSARDVSQQRKAGTAALPRHPQGFAARRHARHRDRDRANPARAIGRTTTRII
jgi:hypothetical protein